MRYPVYERFLTWQGEGVHLGRKAAFIRLYGCPVHCPWCDSAGTWHQDHVPAHLLKETAEELVSWVVSTGAGICVITGGEPTIYDLDPLVSELTRVGVRSHLETSGGFPITGNLDWITLSPKRWQLPLDENLVKADEIKVIVDQPGAIGYWEDSLRGKVRTDSIWLHPEWSSRSDPAVIRAINEAVLAQRLPYRAGFQLHKLYRVDESSAGSRPPVPLGGVQSRGY